jgi:hypothetical protein
MRDGWEIAVIIGHISCLHDYPGCDRLIIRSKSAERRQKMFDYKRENNDGKGYFVWRDGTKLGFIWKTRYGWVGKSENTMHSGAPEKTRDDAAHMVAYYFDRARDKEQ